MFSYEDFDIKLDTDYIGRNFIYVEETDSTNNYLMNNSGLENGTLLFAEFQTNGKGRRNKSWLSNKGLNLTFSILFNNKTLLKRINLVNLAASLSVAQSIENLYQLNIDLKWPNDVLINNKKVAGILIESSSKGTKIDKAVVGIGINVNQPNFSGQFDIKPTSIRLESKTLVNRERLLSELLNIFEENLFYVVDSPQKILNDWRSKCRMIGEKVKIITGNETKTGIFDDIDRDGSLILKNNEQYEKIRFGDISLRHIPH